VVFTINVSQNVVGAFSSQHLLAQKTCDCFSPLVPEDHAQFLIHHKHSGRERLQHTPIDLRIVETLHAGFSTPIPPLFIGNLDSISTSNISRISNGFGGRQITSGHFLGNLHHSGTASFVISNVPEAEVFFSNPEAGSLANLGPCLGSLLVVGMERTGKQIPESVTLRIARI
jgi:hypothetical protein